jgi:Xaa-Pro aminopeptidase
MAPPLKRIRRALRRSGGNLRQAALELKMPRRDLSSLIDAEPELMEQALEAKERALDKAEATIRQAMREGDMVKRMTAAVHIVRASGRWRK